MSGYWPRVLRHSGFSWSKVLPPIGFTVLGLVIAGHFKTKLAVPAVALVSFVIVFAIVLFSASASYHAKVRQMFGRVIDLLGDYTFWDETKKDVEAYDGMIFRHLRKEVQRAQESILAVSLASVGDSEYLSSKKKYAKQREKHLRSIESLIREKKKLGLKFTYRRLIQTNDASGRIPESYKEHDENMQELRGSGIEVGIATVNTTRMTGFIIIDGETLILMLSGVVLVRGTKPNNSSQPDKLVPYLTNLVVVRGGRFSQIVDSYGRYFMQLCNPRL